MEKFYIKLLAGAAGGLILGIILTANGAPAIALLLGPLYIIGIVFGASVVFPWMARIFGVMGKASFLAFLASKPLLGVLALIILPFVLAVVMTIGWCIGFVKVIIEAAGRISTMIRSPLFQSNFGKPKGSSSDWLPDRQSERDSGGSGDYLPWDSGSGGSNWPSDAGLPGDDIFSGDDSFPGGNTFPDGDTFPDDDWLD